MTVFKRAVLAQFLCLWYGVTRGVDCVEAWDEHWEDACKRVGVEAWL